MQGGWFELLTHRLDDHPLGTSAIPFSIEDSLPRSQIELTGGDGDDDFMADGERTEVRGRIVLTRARVVTVPPRVPGRDGGFEPLEDVLPEAGLMVIHEDRRRNVHRGDEDHSFCDS